MRLRILNAITLQGVRIRSHLASRPRPLYLNLGSGPRGLDDPHWINVDGFSDRNVSFALDISRRFPFNDQTFDGVFCEHVLEHFSLEDGECIARELFRTLRPGKAVRIVVPDAEIILQKFFSDPAELAAWRGDSGNETPMELVNSFFRQRYEHQFLYDWPTLQAMLRRAGFENVKRASFGTKRYCSALLLDAPKYRLESLYVEALRL